MTDYIDLAMTYGGFTSLDKVYLERHLTKMSPKDKLTFITPPPSVINAYFAEIYQKQSPKAATDYYFELSQALSLSTDSPSFEEDKPFVRLNLSGKSYGFAYVADQELAQVFAEKAEPISTDILFELAQVFPQYAVYTESGKIFMKPLEFEETEVENLTPENSLLGQVVRLTGNVLKITSFNREEVLELAQPFSGKRYYKTDGRQAILYLTLGKD